MLDIQQTITLSPYTTFGIGGPADFFITAKNIDDIVKGIEFPKEKHIDFFLLGSGANILIGDKGFRGLVIKNEADNIIIDGNIITAESGAVIAYLIAKTAKKGLSGLEHFIGIPSTLGGALWQNLHFLSPDRKRTVYISEIVKSALILTEKNIIKEVSKEYLDFQYDWSILHKSKDIVLSATLALTPQKKEVIQNVIQENLLWRKEKHPEDSVKTSAGSIFKKINGHGAGRLIEKVGLKGYAIGDAQISPQHANFIVNKGNATAKDVRSLISLVQQKVKHKLQLELEPEISFIGEF
jgi:UDP-N-acetylmuramate dehydrogenase